VPRNQHDIDPARDAEIYAAYVEAGHSGRALAKTGRYGGKMGILSAVRRHKATQGEAYGTGGIGQGAERDGHAPYVIKGVSTYFDADGNQRAQWVKTRLDDEQRQEAIRAAAEALAQNIPPAEPVTPPAATLADLLNLYVFTDYHVGMLAWHREGGQDWDLAIAEKLITNAYRHMIDNAPAAKMGIVCQLGDWFHYDSFKPLTPASGHLLDADSRFPKMIEAGVRILRRIVGMALERHEQVIVLHAEGNHDEASSVWLRVMFKALFENEPRVTVEDSPLPFYAYQHGNVMLAFHHGHKVRMDGLPALFASQFREMWGQTTMAYGHSGHYHHEVVKEFSGIKWMQHPTLAARDAYAARGGYHAERAAYAITYHAKYGQVSTLTVKPEMFE
jgi:hypothetical protein